MKANYTVVAFLLVLTFFDNTSSAQTSIQWQQFFSGYQSVEIRSIVQTTDGGFVTCGYSNSYANNTAPDVWVAKLASDGSLEWQKFYGGSGNDYGDAILQTKDGGYVVAAETFSGDRDVIGFHGGYNDIWLLKLSPTGQIEWQQCYGGTGDDACGTVIQTSDGGYFLTGATGSNNGNVAGSHPFADAWVLKLNSVGAIEWQKSFGGSNTSKNYTVDSECFCTSAVQMADGSFALAGWEEVRTKDFPGGHGKSDCWAGKLNPSGELQWMREFGGSSEDGFSKIIATSDGGFAAVGYTTSKDFDASDNYWSYTTFIVKMDANGNPQWHKCLGSYGGNYGPAIVEVTDGYLISTTTTDVSTPGYHGGNVDALMIKINFSGDILWKKCFGGSDNDYFNILIKTSDGNIVVGGQTWSKNGDVAANTSDYGGWLIKLQTDAGVKEEESKTTPVSTSFDPLSDMINIHYSLAHESETTIEIYSIMGERVYRTTAGVLGIGYHSSNISAASIAAGTYFIRILSGNNIQTKSFQIFR